MAASPTTNVIEQLRRVALLRDSAALDDGELLGRFLERRDQAALAALVRRHGPMVWGVCRRILNHHDAEDAFQATFLVLVRKATSIVRREMVGNWLYGVAHQTALHARRTAARRRAREVQVTAMPEPGNRNQESGVRGQESGDRSQGSGVRSQEWSEVQPLLDQELSRLPEMYRAVLVLCDLEDRTRKEVARQLGIPEGTVAGRLARARAMLAKRLARRGVALSGAALAAALSQNAASAGVPSSVVSSTITAANLLAAGQTTAGAIAPKVAALTEGVLRAMMMSKSKGVVAVVLFLGIIAAAATALVYQQAAAQGDQPPIVEQRVTPPPKREKEDTETFTAWGKEVGGLQAGLGYHAGQKRVYRDDETVSLVVRLRNVGKEEVKFQYLREFFIENPPAVTDADGKPVLLEKADALGFHTPVDVSLAPGKEIDLYRLKLELRPAKESGSYRDNFLTLHGPGKHQIQYERIFGSSWARKITLDPVLTKLATGKLELEVKEAENQEKEGFTAWGEEIGGLQAGLGYYPGRKRAYSYGETVRLLVRLRNVGKEEVAFHYLQPFFEHAPTVTDGAGKQVPQRDIPSIGGRLPGEVRLAPGKEIELHELTRELRPPGESGNNRRTTLFGTGKVSVQYEHVLGMPAMGRPGWKLDPVLGKLATGKLELEIDSGEPLKTAPP